MTINIQTLKVSHEEIVLGKSGKIFLALAILFTLLFVAWGVVRIVHTVSFNLNCAAYLKRATDANTIEMAKAELAKAIEYAEKNELTEGIVSVFLQNPKNDIGFWYNNMKAAHEELDTLPEDATPLERTNVLMKLRESFTDNDNSNTAVTVPDGITIHPYNVIYFWYATITLIFACTFWTLFLVLIVKQAEEKVSATETKNKS